MDSAEQCIAGSARHGTVVVARRQTAGRGRDRDRPPWRSTPGANILLTVMLERAADDMEIGAVPLRVGCAVADIAESFGLEPRIKWPNDVLIGASKLAGVLIELKRGWLLIGIGLNCNQRHFPRDAGRATSLRVCLGRRVDTRQIEGALLLAVHRSLADPAWASQLRRRLAGLGRPVRVEQLQGTLRGVIRGVDDHGALELIDSAGALSRVTSGHLSL